MLGNALEEAIAAFDSTEVGTAVFAVFGRMDFSSVLVGHQLSAIADTEHRVFFAESRKIRVGGRFVANRIRASGKNYAFEVGPKSGNFIVRVDFAVDIEFPDAAGNQLGILGSEIEDQNHFMHGRKGSKNKAAAARGFPAKNR
jgi:Zn-dependent M28 family amino/carboxypeptidase